MLSIQQPTATNTRKPTPTEAPSPTFTSTPTPTPTATAVSAKLSGNPRIIGLTAEPEPKSGASCGIVDVFDFPIAPPDGQGVSRGGGDFGQYRQRYDKYHAGEDWGSVGGGSNFGKPVYSIGHGRVMYAQPEGWNRDKGVVIVEHAVGENRQIMYSFYGHLDPSSVVLEPGTCVIRGDHVGNIGKPRTPPHLHFEIRTHMPYSPGPGYWEEDPTTAGWLPPSQTIWNQRMASSPGVVWLRPFSPRNSQPIGLWRENSFLTLEDSRLMQTNLETGSTQLSPLTEKEIDNALLHPQTNTLFLQTKDNVLTAFAEDLLWELELGRNGRSVLLPLPNGGVMVIRGKNAVGLSANGDVLWQEEVAKRPFAWTLTDFALIYTFSGSDSSTWTATDRQPPTNLSNKTGHPFVVGSEIWLYATGSLVRLNPGNTEPFFSLPPARLDVGDSLALPDSGGLIIHSDLRDRRLVAFNQDGTPRWDVSVANLPAGIAHLAATYDHILLFIESSDDGDVQTHLYTINPDNGDLTYIFNGGTRPFSWNDTWISAAGSLVIINSAGGAILALDVQEAIDAVSN